MLNTEQKKYLRKLAHDKKPVVWTGQSGLTDTVLEEIDSTLEHHELIKIKIRGADKQGRTEIAETVCNELGSDLVQIIGNVITLYRRKRRNAVINLP